MSHLFLHETAADWASGSFDHTRTAAAPGEGLELEAHHGSFTSFDLFAPFAPSEAILSVDLRHADPASTGMIASLSCSSDGQHWSQWYRALAWGVRPDEGSVIDGPEGRVKVDVFKLVQPMLYWRYRVTWHDSRKKAIVRRTALNLYSASENVHAVDSEVRSAWGKRLNVPFFSQWDVKKHAANRVCSPTSLAMAANFHGVSSTPDELASAAYDRTHDLYGNWPLNTLAASLDGLRAYVDRGTSIRFLEDRIASGLPTVASLAFGEEELSGAPIEKTDGHLVVVAGFDTAGNPVVRDPAARGADAWITYNRVQFARAWLGHGGIAYIVEPEA